MNNRLYILFFFLHLLLVLKQISWVFFWLVFFTFQTPASLKKVHGEDCVAARVTVSEDQTGSRDFPFKSTFNVHRQAGKTCKTT